MPVKLAISGSQHANLAARRKKEQVTLHITRGHLWLGLGLATMCAVYLQLRHGVQYESNLGALFG